MTPSVGQKRALQIIKLASEQEDRADQLRNSLRWIASMVKAGDAAEKIIAYIEESLEVDKANVS